jgi:hypothetical protein
MKKLGKTIMLSMIIIFVGLLVVITLVGCLFSAPGYRGPKSDHYDGDRFYNQDRSQEKGFGDFLKWMVNRNQGVWKGDPTSQPSPAPPQRVDRGELRVTFVNHATVLIQIDGLNILTDPIWSERASPVNRILGARHSMAIHFKTFSLGDDGEHDPVLELRQELEIDGLTEEEFWILEFGEGRQIQQDIERRVSHGSS